MEGNGLLAKFWGYQDPDLYGGTVIGRSLDGFPMLGSNVPHMTQGEMENLAHYSNFKKKFFCLWKPEDSELFDKVMDHVYNGEFFIKKRIDIQVHDSPDGEPGGSLKVYLEWVQVMAKAPSWSAAQVFPPPAPEFSANIPLVPEEE